MGAKRWGAGFLVLFPLLALSFSNVEAVKNVYLYDQSVVSEIDLAKYTSTGQVLTPQGQPFNGSFQKGPAPAPYPQIAVSERSFEQLGPSSALLDGVVFVNHVQHYIALKKAIVLWIIRVPNAASRAATEFAQDLNLSLFVDWNQDTVWKENERAIGKLLNIADQFPTTEDAVVIYYLTTFIVPDVADMQSNAMYGNSGKELRYLWARAVLAYDDADVNADGAQLFGGYEDYRIAYQFRPTVTPTN